jgi:putative ABC transport system substrate-binding protein
MNFHREDREGQNRLAALAQGLRELGWTDGGTIRIEARWSGDDVDLCDRLAEELVALSPDVLVASASQSVASLQRATRSIPIVFANVIDPVGAGFVTSVARPRGNTTGFIAFEYSISGKWLELLKKLAPQTTRIVVLRDPALAAGIGQFAAIQSAASSSSMELSAIDSRDSGEIERGLAAFAREPNGGIITTASASAITHRRSIISLATGYRLPNIYPFRYYPDDGGLASYGPDAIEPFRRAAGYVDRIFKGAAPSELPVQAPTKYQLILNLKTAKGLGLEIPTSLLATAEEVIE